MVDLTCRMDFSDLERARIFATAAHAAVGQKRKYTGEDYIVHPADVVRILMTVPHITEMVMAAWLHDVLEDTSVTLNQLVQEFGVLVGSYVSGLSNVAEPAHGARHQRFLINCEHLARQPREVQTIKCADIISNVSTIVRHDPKFAAVYLKEKRHVLDLLVKADRVLWQQAYDVLNVATQQLEQIT